MATTRKPDYDGILRDFKSQRSGRIKRQVRNVLDLIRLSSGERILEIGVATGKFTSIASKHNTVVCVDLVFGNLQRARQTVDELGEQACVTYINANGAALPLANGIFDKVLAIDIIEHLDDATLRALCAEAHRVLRSGGSFFIYTPNLLHPYELARPFRPVLRREHIGVRTRRSIVHFLADAGFHIRRGYFNNCFRRISIEAYK